MARYSLSDNGATLLIAIPLSESAEWVEVPERIVKGTNGRPDRKMPGYVLATLGEMGSRFGGEETGLRYGGYPIRVKGSAWIKRSDPKTTTAPERKVVGTITRTAPASTTAPTVAPASKPANGHATA